MTKEAELKLLEQIDALIKSADEGDYIPMTFDGIVEVCRRNITDDFGDQPVRDLELERERFSAEVRMHDETKRLLAEAQGKLKEAIRDAEGMMNRITELTEERDAIAECVDGNNSIIDQAEAEIRNLKAEIVRMRMERMTEDDMALMYDRMRGDFDD